MTVLLLPLTIIAPLALMGFCLHRYEQQRSIFTGRVYSRTRTFWIAQGRGYGNLTGAKVSGLQADGYRIGRNKRGSFINVSGESRLDAVLKARELAFKHHLMFLY